jgi:hypothetical protein
MSNEKTGGNAPSNSPDMLKTLYWEDYKSVPCPSPPPQRPPPQPPPPHCPPAHTAICTEQFRNQQRYENCLR